MWPIDEAQACPDRATEEGKGANCNIEGVKQDQEAKGQEEEGLRGSQDVCAVCWRREN